MVHTIWFVEAIHGNWTNWTSWSNCSVSCGSGFNERTRHCSNPRPKFGGDNCIGADKETIVCDTGTLCPGGLHYRLHSLSIRLYFPLLKCGWI
jgi:hypothetical protein